MLALVTATSREMQAAVGDLGAPDVGDGAVAEWACRGRDMLLAVSGIGVINAGLTLGRLLERNISGLVNAGIAGSFDTGTAPLESVWLADREVWPEYGLAREDGSIDARGINFPLGKVDGAPVFDRLDLSPRKAAADMGLTGVSGFPTAHMLTVSAVTGSPDRARGLMKTFDVLLENMEGFALAFGCARKGVPFLELRTVSNVVGSRDRKDWNIEGAMRVLGNACGRLLQSELT